MTGAPVDPAKLAELIRKVRAGWWDDPEERRALRWAIETEPHLGRQYWGHPEVVRALQERQGAMKHIGKAGDRVVEAARGAMERGNRATGSGMPAQCRDRGTR